MQSNRDKVSDTVARWEGLLPSQKVSHKEVKVQTDKKVTYLTQPAPQYTENGPEGMVDNIYGDINYRIGGWQGWQEDFVAVVELDKEKPVKMVGVNCLESMRSWIFYPKGMKVEYSMDGENWMPYGELDLKEAIGDNPQAHQGESHTQLFAAVKNVRTRFFRITVNNFGKLPDWHLSAGEQAWLFVDEIVVM